MSRTIATVRSWERLTPYELRNLPAHLAVLNREIDLRRVSFDLDYEYAVCGELGLAALQAVIDDVIAARAVDAGLTTIATELLSLVRRAAPFFGTRDPVDRGAFVNHIALHAARLADRALSDALTWDETLLGQEGWIELAEIRGTVASAGRRFMMPGQLKSYGWDSYGAGPAGSRTTFAVDLRRLRLLGETVDLYYDEWVGYEPDKFHWRIWDLRSGVMIKDESKSATGYPTRQAPDPPSEFAEDHLVRPAARADHLQAWELECVNGPEQLLVDRKPGGALCCLLRDPSGSANEVALPPGVEPDLLVRIDEQPAVVARGAQIVYLVALAPTGHVVDMAISDLGTSDSTGLIVWSEGDVLCTFDETTRQTARTASGEPYAQAGALPSPQPRGEALASHDYLQETITTPPGKCTYAKWRLHVDRFDRASEELLGTFAGSDTFSGGGSTLDGWAVSPDERRLIASLNGRSLAVWNLEEPGVHGPAGSPLARIRLPDRALGDAALDGGVTDLAFFWGGVLVAAGTGTQELLVIRVSDAPEVLARVGIEWTLKRLVATPFGDAIFALETSGALTRYRFSYLPAADVTSVSGDILDARLRCPLAEEVELAGTFNTWAPQALSRIDDEVWHARRALTPGLHEYKFKVDGERWVLDPHVPFRPGPIGLNNYVLVGDEG